MANSLSKLNQALRDFIEAYIELHEDLDEKLGADEDSFNHAIVESLETTIDSALEEVDFSSTQLANMLSFISDALEQLDPSAFDQDEDDDGFDLGGLDYGDNDDDDDIDLDEEEED